MSLRPLLLAAIFAALGLPVIAGDTYQAIPFSALNGWQDDDHAAALEAFKVTCGDMSGEEWESLCEVAQQKPNARLYVETFFQPVMTKTTEPALFTGYYEPELDGSLTRTGRFRYPIYGVPKEVRAGGLWKTRRDIEENQVLKGRGLELAWVENPADIFFLQIQGSGRVRLQDGTTIRLGFGGSNGHRYQAIQSSCRNRTGNSSPISVIDTVRPRNDRNPPKSTCPAIDLCFNELGHYRFF